MARSAGEHTPGAGPMSIIRSARLLARADRTIASSRAAEACGWVQYEWERPRAWNAVQLPPRAPPGDGDVRAGGRHVADERVDLGRRARPRHHGERGAGGDRARGARVGRVHPHRRQDRRPDRAQARLHPRPARLRRGRDRDGVRTGPRRDHPVLGGHRRHRRLAAAARHAVAHPRQLRGSRPEARLRARRCLGRHRRRRRAAPRRIHHHVPLLAGRLRARGRDHRRGAGRHRTREGRALSRRAVDRLRRGGCCRSWAWAAS